MKKLIYASCIVIVLTPLFITANEAIAKENRKKNLKQLNNGMFMNASKLK